MAGEQYEVMTNGEMPEDVQQREVSVVPYNAVQTAPVMRSSGFLPVLSVAEMVGAYKMMKEFIKEVMVKDHDYGFITQRAGEKPSLFKPGAEKLNKFWGHSVVCEITKRTEDWETLFFEYEVRCTLARDGVIVTQQFGTCSSYESKYRWRNAERLCPECQQPAIMKSKFPPRNTPNAPPGFYCYDKKGGCGANFVHDDPRIVAQEVGRETNPDMADVKNTVLQIAQKRALVNATKIGCMASEFFTSESGDYGGQSETVNGNAGAQRQSQRPPETQRREAPASAYNSEAAPNNGLSTQAQQNAIAALAKRVYREDSETKLSGMTGGQPLTALTQHQAGDIIDKLQILISEAAQQPQPEPAPAAKAQDPNALLNANQQGAILKVGSKLWQGSAVGEIKKLSPEGKPLAQLTIAEGRALVGQLTELVKANPDGIKLPTKTRAEEAAEAAPDIPAGNYKPKISAPSYPAFVKFCNDRGWGSGVAQHILNAAKIEGFFEPEITAANFDDFEAAVKKHFHSKSPAQLEEEYVAEEGGLSDDELDQGFANAIDDPAA